MSWSSSGMVIDKIGERYPGMSGTARHVLGVMATFVGRSDRDRTEPTCFAAYATIAAKAGYSERTIRTAVGELERHGAIVRAGAQVRTESGGAKRTVRWGLAAVVALTADVADKGRGGDPTAESADKGTAESADKGTAESADNPSDLLRPPGSRERRRSVAADAPAPSADAGAGAAAPSADAGAGAAAPSTTGAGIVAEVMAARGCSQADAEAWGRRKLAAATTPVRNEVAFLRECLVTEAAALSKRHQGGQGGRPAAARGKTPATTATASSGDQGGRTGGPTPRQLDGARRAADKNRGKAPRIRNGEAAAVAQRYRDGETVEAVAAAMSYHVGAVEGEFRRLATADARAAVDRGEPVEQVAERFPLAGRVENLRARRVENVTSALAKGEPAEQVAERNGETVDAVMGMWRTAWEKAQKVPPGRRPHPPMPAPPAPAAVVAVVPPARRSGYARPWSTPAV